MTDLGLDPALAALAQDAGLQWEAGPDGGLVVGE